PRGVRHKGGASPILARTGNLGTCRLDVKGGAQGEAPREPEYRGGAQGRMGSEERRRAWNGPGAQGPNHPVSSAGQPSDGEEPDGEPKSEAQSGRQVNPAMGRNLAGRCSPGPGDKSRMSREAPVRFRE